MSSLTSLAVSLIFIIGICVLPRVSSDCSSCCSYGTGCGTAYNGASGKCCNTGSIFGFCCPSGSTCMSGGYCRIEYLSIGAIVGIIFGCIILCTSLIIVCIRLLRRRQTVIVGSTYAPQQQQQQQQQQQNQQYQNPSAYYTPSPPPPAYKV